MFLKNVKRFGAIAALVTMAAVSSGMTASADTPPAGVGIADRVFSSADPKAALAALDASERKAFDDATLVAKSETRTVGVGLGANAGKIVNSLDEGVSANGCWYFSFSGWAKAAAGNTLYTYWQNTAVCASGGTITSVWVDNARGETSTIGWRIDKPAVTWVKNVGWEGRGVAEYFFVLGAGGIDIQHPTTCLQGRVNANGSDKASSLSCNIG